MQLLKKQKQQKNTNYRKAALCFPVSMKTQLTAWNIKSFKTF